MPEIDLAVIPRAGSDRVGPYRDGVLRMRVTRPPAEGDANRAVLRLLARALAVPVSDLSVTAGQRARRKRVSIAGIDVAELARRLATLDAD